jgi:hypothetical protein
MKPQTRPYERRLSKRFDMVTRDCRLTLIRVRGGKHERETCILVDLSHDGLHFRGFRPVEDGEMVEFLVNLGTPLGYVAGRVCWVRALGSNEYDCGVRFLERSKGLLTPDEKSLSFKTF